ncbi:glycoside hydrolase [Lenzites betulinus]|nr:glycoside hydrolase [Lenzites betulinus]
MGYYPDWAGETFPPEKIDFTRFDWVDFAFAVPGAAFGLSWDGADDAPALLARVVALAHAAGKKVKLSVGGWDGSRYFSAAAATPEGRATLVGSIRALYTQFALDGIDLDWEYPAQAGAPGNGASADDGARFLDFLRALRAGLPASAVITAAAQTAPFAGKNGAPMRDVAPFAGVLDWVLLMNYDTYGSSPTPGPNAPLGDACHNSTQAGASALAALRAWTAAGFPAQQLVLGVPSYGYISRSDAVALRARDYPRAPVAPSNTNMRRATQKPKGTRKANAARRVLGWVGALVETAGAGVLGPDAQVHNEAGGTDDGQIQFRDLVAQGVLVPYFDSNSTDALSSAPGTPQQVPATAHKNGTHPPAPERLFAGGAGFARGWDACSSTPFLRSAAARQVVAYDDPDSLAMKAQLVRAAGMRGVNMFDMSGDTDEGDLVKALWHGLGRV